MLTTNADVINLDLLAFIHSHLRPPATVVETVGKIQMLPPAGDRYCIPLTALFLPHEAFFNLGINLVQPLLGTISAILIRRELGFQFRNTALRRA
jgi:hypothetical protein